MRNIPNGEAQDPTLQDRPITEGPPQEPMPVQNRHYSLVQEQPRGSRRYVIDSRVVASAAVTAPRSEVGQREMMAIEEAGRLRALAHKPSICGDAPKRGALTVRHKESQR